MTRHVFIGLLGGSPAVITESLWALLHPEKLADPARRNQRRIVPDKAHIICTANPGFFPDTDERERVIKEKIGGLFKQAGERAPELIMAPAPDPEEPDLGLMDIRTQAENTAMARHINNVLLGYTDDTDTAVHFSLAGGRKTMSSHAQSAMMFFGRQQDELFHILLTNDIYERFGVRDFWYPGQKWPARLLPSPGSDGKERELPATLEDVRVDLIDVPFAPLRMRLPRDAPPEAKDPELIVGFHASLNTPVLLDFKERSVSTDNGRTKIYLEPIHFALYMVYAVARYKSWKGAGPPEEGIGDNAAGWVLVDDYRYGLAADGSENYKDPLLLLRDVYFNSKSKVTKDRDTVGDWEDKSLVFRAMNTKPEPGRGNDWHHTRSSLRGAFSERTAKKRQGKRRRSVFGNPLVTRSLAPDYYNTDPNNDKSPAVEGLNIAPGRFRFENFPEEISEDWL